MRRRSRQAEIAGDARRRAVRRVARAPKSPRARRRHAGRVGARAVRAGGAKDGYGRRPRAVGARGALCGRRVGAPLDAKIARAARRLRGRGRIWAAKVAWGTQSRTRAIREARDGAVRARRARLGRRASRSLNAEEARRALAAARARVQRRYGSEGACRTEPRARAVDQTNTFSERARRARRRGRVCRALGTKIAWFALTAASAARQIWGAAVCARWAEARTRARREALCVAV